MTRRRFLLLGLLLFTPASPRSAKYLRWQRNRSGS